MKTATVRELRNEFAKLEAWLGEGEEIRIEKRGEVIAVLKPVGPDSPVPFRMPDFRARQKAIWGERVFTRQEIDDMRADELEGEEG
ncbi:hypothetical protein OVA24_03655 [Luteolibacter sp. SL250]|uniref:type II toxin-antitoxin system Phd/YefM family antitoxin n=1 Tax=Luteolibacter sp. SL250 TaxID=2995170 RepID=UPI0022716E52|nr:hypothetical protein [Luteolibacter sp. SL250]WAC20474.1 hypothetical protein OVA24_03655 [Luteolibacter sp. SL250]